MVKINKFIKNSDFDASFQQYHHACSVYVSGSKVSDGRKFSTSFNIPEGQYISDVAIKTNLDESWRCGSLANIYYEPNTGNGAPMGSYSLYSYLRRTGKDRFSAEVYCDVFGGGQSFEPIPAMRVDFMVTFSSLPV